MSGKCDLGRFFVGTYSYHDNDEENVHALVVQFHNIVAPCMYTVLRSKPRD